MPGVETRTRPTVPATHTKFSRALVIIVLSFWAFTLAVFAFTFLTGNAALQMRLAGLGR